MGEEAGTLASNEVSFSVGSIVMWIQPVGVTLVLRLVVETRLPSDMFSAAIWNCFS